MKVLMFGWEFPPHISGGLGTACYGLTTSLSKEKDVDVLFVVPKLHGEEAADRTTFINASRVPVSKANNLEQYLSDSTVKPEIRKALFNVLKKEEGVQRIEVPSTLSPYRAPAFEQSAAAVEHWN